jgi:hypothetical protein
MKGTIAITVALALLLSSPVSGPTQCAATPIQWDGNGHWYELVQERLTWDQARAAAESMAWFGFSGHLATVTSSEENAYVFWTVCAGTTQAWLGGYQDPPESQPAENWHWVTGEPWEYSHWLSGEPNDFFGAYSESCLQYSMALDGTWNDLPNDGGQPAYLPYTFVVEYAGPLTGVDHDVVLETSVALCATPNPFDDDLLLTYRLGDKTPVRVAVYDVRGRLVSDLLDEWQLAGTRSLRWNGRDRAGREVPSGVYLVAVVTDLGTVRVRAVHLR